MDDDTGITFKKALKWLVAAVVIIAAIKMAFWLAGIAFALGTFLLFAVGPIILLGWLTVKLIRYLRSEPV